MRKPFKMKGYSYPGKSPLREDTKSEVKISKDSKSNFDWNTSNTVHEAPSSKPSEKPKDTSKNIKTGEEVEVKVDANLVDRQEKSARAAERGEFFKGLAGDAGKALLEAGVQVGVNALLTPKNKSTRKGPDVSGFSGIQFGRS